jgi:hypothetical protein
VKAQVPVAVQPAHWQLIARNRAKQYLLYRCKFLIDEKVSTRDPRLRRHNVGTRSGAL